MTNAQAFSARVKELIAQSRAMTPAVRKNILGLLDEARRQIIAQLASMDPNRFSAAQLQALKVSIDNAMETFRAQAVNSVMGFQTLSAGNGISMVDGPLTAAFGPMALGKVSQSTLAIAQGYTADLITALSKTAAANVNAAIQRAFLGGQSMNDIVEQIGRGINGGKFDGVFGPIGERAQTIAVNEILRVQSIATQARFEDLKDRHPDLQKQWIHIPAARMPRQLHIFASGQVVNIEEPFQVAGEELMYPRDPNGSPWNTINCHCLMRPYFAPEALKSSSADKALLDKLGITVTVTHAA